MGHIPHGIRYRSGLVAAGAVGRGSGVALCIRHADAAPGDIRHGRGRVAAAIGVRQFHTRGGVAARGGGHDAVKVLLRNRKTTDRHRFGGDGGCGAAAVPDSFRICILNTPLHRSQAAFVHRNHFTFQRGAQLRDKLLLRAGERLPGGVVAGRGGEAENPLLSAFRAGGIFRDGRILHRRLLCQGQRLSFG